MPFPRKPQGRKNNFKLPPGLSSGRFWKTSWDILIDSLNFNKTVSSHQGKRGMCDVLNCCNRTMRIGAGKTAPQGYFLFPNSLQKAPKETKSRKKSPGAQMRRGNETFSQLTAESPCAIERDRLGHFPRHASLCRLSK